MKHLSEEALEAAADPDDLEEWADMFLLLWGAQWRAGISDAAILSACCAKLEKNKRRQWLPAAPGEPRKHVRGIAD